MRDFYRSGLALTYLKVTMTVDEKVFWLQIPVDNIQVVEILERQNDLSSVEPRVGLATKRRKKSVSI